MDRTVSILSDTLDIVRRIKGIDKGYGIRYNLTRNRFEITHLRSGGETVLVLPYRKLDCRSVEYVRRTRVERAEALFREIEVNNARLERERERSIADETAYKARSLAQYVRGGGRDIPSYNEI